MSKRALGVIAVMVLGGCAIDGRDVRALRPPSDCDAEQCAEPPDPTGAHAPELPPPVNSLTDCVGGATECTSAQERVPCEASGRWIDRPTCELGCTGGSCDDECQPGESTTCGALQNALGVCSDRELECGSDGRWPRALCAPSSEEVCDADELDENCNGLANEDPACTPGFAAISAGPGYACAITTAGGVSCWGANGFLTLGDGSPESSRPRPGPVPGVSGARSLSTGLFGACAVLDDGSARCWGSNGNGDGTQARLLELSGLRQLALGETNSCALLQNGSVRCASAGPGALAGFSAVQDERGGDLANVESIDTQGDTFFCALMRGGSASCWGFGSGFPGVSFGFPVNTARVISEITGASQVVAGAAHACALISGDVVCWGDNLSAQLGAEPQLLASSETPVAIDITEHVEAIDAGDYHTCALLENARVRCWGLLGAEVTPAPREIDGINRAVSISAGQDATCVVRSDATAACFGDNRSGQLGNGRSTGDSAFEAEFLPPVTVLEP